MNFFNNYNFNDSFYVDIFLPKVHKFLKLLERAWNLLKITHAYDLVMQCVLGNIISLSKKEKPGNWRLQLESECHYSI